MATKIEVVTTYPNVGSAGITESAVTVQSANGSTGGIADYIWIKQRSGENQPAYKRLKLVGPVQDGASNMGHLLEPRAITWQVEIWGNSAAQLSTNLASFYNLIAPVRVPAIPVQNSNFFQANVHPQLYKTSLRYTLANGHVRSINVFGQALELNSFQRGTKFIQTLAVKWTCPSPLFYNPTPNSLVLAGGSNTSGTLTYYGNYPDYEPIIILGGTYTFSGAGAGTLSASGSSVGGPTLTFTDSISTTSQKLAFTNNVLSGVAYTMPTIVVNCKDHSVVVNTTYKQASAFLSDDSDLPNLRLWPGNDPTTTTTSGNTITVTYTVVSGTGGSYPVAVYSFEKYIALES